MQLVAVAAVGVVDTVHCTGDVVENIAADSDRDVVRCCREAVNRHFVICAQLSDIRKQHQLHSCTGQTSSCSTCLKVQYNSVGC